MIRPEDHGMDGERLARFIAGECADDERAEIRAWMRADPARAELVASLQAVWEVTDSEDATWDVDRAWDTFTARRAAEPRRSAAAVSVSRSRRGAAMWALRGAAGVVLLLGGALLWNQLGRPMPGADPLETREIATGPAERTRVELADGTGVVLAPESRLRVASGYGGESREVELEGQAAFDVASDSARPFRVHTHAVVTEVIGTRFGVRAYAGEPEVSVALAEGAVRLRGTGAPEDARGLMLRPGQVARVAADGELRLEADASIDAMLAWTDGRLVFEDTPLEDVAIELGRWYDVEVRLADATLAGRRLTASFGEEPISQVLDLIALSLDLRYDRDGGVIVFSER